MHSELRYSFSVNAQRHRRQDQKFHFCNKKERSLEKEDVDGPAEGLTPPQQKTLDDWITRFNLKYPKVGTLVESGAPKSRSKL